MDASHIVDQVLTASTALAGLLLVSIGAAAASFDSYGAEAQQAVKGKYQRRGWFSFLGFACALLSALSGLGFYWHKATWLLDTSTILLVAALLAAFVAALIAVMDIR